MKDRFAEGDDEVGLGRAGSGDADALRVKVKDEMSSRLPFSFR